MITVRKPTPQSIERFIAVQSALAFTYSAVGATAEVPPSNFAVDHTRVRLGEGRAIFEAAKTAIGNWQQFSLGWLEAWPANTPISAGATVAVIVRAAGLWWLNSARIVYVVDETNETTSRYGFAYGTLPGHVEMGEERFLIEWDRSDDAVWYDILAFSRPRHFLTRVGRRQVRRMQKRFGQDSAVAMVRAVRQSGHPAA